MANRYKPPTPGQARYLGELLRCIAKGEDKKMLLKAARKLGTAVVSTKGREVWMRWSDWPGPWYVVISLENKVKRSETREVFRG